MIPSFIYTYYERQFQRDRGFRSLIREWKQGHIFQVLLLNAASTYQPQLTDTMVSMIAPEDCIAKSLPLSFTVAGTSGKGLRLSHLPRLVVPKTMCYFSQVALPHTSIVYNATTTRLVCCTPVNVRQYFDVTNVRTGSSTAYVEWPEAMIVMVVTDEAPHDT